MDGHTVQIRREFEKTTYDYDREKAAGAEDCRNSSADAGVKVNEGSGAGRKQYGDD